MSKTKSLFVKEMKELLAIASVFFIIFSLFSVLKMALLGQYQIEGYTAGAAVVGALIMAKVVLIFDYLPLAKKLKNYPKIVTVISKSGVYLIGFAVFSVLEQFVKGLIDYQSAMDAIEHALTYLGSSDFLLTATIVYVSFLFFSTFWAIRNEYGSHSLYLLFFKKK